jgi:hypothetical protein
MKQNKYVWLSPIAKIVLNIDNLHQIRISVKLMDAPKTAFKK